MDPFKREREVDPWLEAALSQYGKAEPRPGLETRVLASLQAEQNRVGSRSRWWWGPGVAAAIAAFSVAVWLGHGERTWAPARMGTAAIKHDGGADARPTTLPVAQSPMRPVARPPLRGRLTQRGNHAPEVADVARLEQFPAPAPLSDQEKLLERYVQEFPHSAALIARAQTDLGERNALEMAAPWPKSIDTNGSEQQE